MTSRVIVSMRMSASPARVFQAFTEEVGVWWRPNTLFQFTPRDPGRVAFQGGQGGRFMEILADGKEFEIGRITAWEPGVRLAFGWRQASFSGGQHTHVEVRFEPVENGTRVTIEHVGWDSIPASHVARHGFPGSIFLRRLGEWWTDLLAACASSIQ